MKALILTVVALGLAGYLTRTWPMGEAAAVLVAVLVVALAIVGYRSERVPVVDPERPKLLAALRKLDKEREARELRNFMAITSVRRSDQ